jgi:hypothetical protein
MSHDPRMTVAECFTDLLSHPKETLLDRWNWKSAVFSSIIRALLFFFANVTAGMAAALGAMYVEFLYRSVTAGFYGAITQHFRKATPRWLASLVVGLGLPFVSHAIELGVHWARGTAHLKTSIIVSVCFTIISTLYNLHAMRQGCLVVGSGSRSIGSDLRDVPRTIGTFLLTGFGLLGSERVRSAEQDAG